jgi:hypothetical protein
MQALLADCVRVNLRGWPITGATASQQVAQSDNAVAMVFDFFMVKKCV